MTDTDTFAQFGQHFQETLMRGLLTDAQWAAQMEEVCKVEYFDQKYVAYLAEMYFDYSRKYKAYPTLKLLLDIVKGDLKQKQSTDAILCEQVIDYVKRIKSDDNHSDLPYVKDKALDFCRRQAFIRAIEDAVPQLIGGDSDYAKIANEVRLASMVGTVATLGHDFEVDREAVFNIENRRTIPTGYPELDAREVLDGGLGAGEIGVVVAATGVGKSHWLVSVGAHAMMQKKNVLHYTFELSEVKVATRYYSHICEMDSTDVPTNKEKVLETVDGMKLGRLMVKYYATKTCTVQKMRSHIEKCVLKGFIPDLIIVDYADIMRSTRQYEQVRLEITEVYEELRGLAGDILVPIWTASQSNREGANSDMVDLTNMSESYGKAQTADFVISISRKSEEKALGVGRLFVAKNRAGRDGMMYDLAIDTAQSRFGIRGGGRLPGEYVKMDDDERQRKFQETWKKLRSDPGLLLEKTI